MSLDAVARLRRNFRTSPEQAAIAEALVVVAEAQERQAEALERIADRLDSWHVGDLHDGRGEVAVRGEVRT